MALTVWLAAATLGYPQGGGHFWAYLNWALGLRALGCRVVWLEGIDPAMPADRIPGLVGTLQTRLERYGLASCLALCMDNGGSARPWGAMQALDLDAAGEADLLLSISYTLGSEVVGRFRQSALIDIDPGQTQIWLGYGHQVARYGVYFSIGETVGRPEARFPSAGLAWQYTPPCVAIDWWMPHGTPADAAFTTVSHWHSQDWIEEEGQWFRNDKRTGFLPFLDLPGRTDQPLELAICLSADEEEERRSLQERGWRVRHAYEVASTPSDYHHYVQHSRGEFSCAKPSYVRLQNAWVSDRTLCYLASGKPCVVQHTGASRFLPEHAGLFRFHDIEGAARCLETVAADYERQSQLARALAEEYFDARKVVAHVLERALS